MENQIPASQSVISKQNETSIEQNEQPMSKHSDPLYGGLLRGEKAAIKTLYEKCRPQIIRYVKANSGTADEGHDVFVTAIEVLYLKLQNPDFVGYVPICTYLYSVARNTWLKILRKKGQLKEVTLSEGKELRDETDIEDSLITHSKHTLFREKFNKLKQDCQQVMQYFFEKKSMAEIAKLMGYTEAYAKKKKHNCQAKLIQLIKDDPRFKELNDDE